MVLESIETFVYGLLIIATVLDVINSLILEMK